MQLLVGLRNNSDCSLQICLIRFVRVKAAKSKQELVKEIDLRKRPVYGVKKFSIYVQLVLCMINYQASNIKFDDIRIQNVNLA